MKKLVFTLIGGLVALAPFLTGAATTPATAVAPAGGDRHRKQDLASLPPPVGCWSPAQVIAGRPGWTTIDLDLLSTCDCKGTLEYEGGSVPLDLRGGTPKVVHLDRLVPDHAYTYRLVLGGVRGPEGHFHTKRRPGSPFTFTIQGDSHSERGHQNDATVYAAALRRVATDRPDFHIALGDDFSVDQKRGALSGDIVDAIYRAHRPWFSLVDAPLFLVNGNHEQAALCNLDGTAENVAVWAGNAREKYYPQPASGGIYTGDTGLVDHIGLLRDYYAWQWGDALFVVLDPYWHSPVATDNRLGTRDKNTDPWRATIGDEQYWWLKRTLETSTAKFKFVLIHHVNGTGRGITCAKLYEWGGQDRNGQSGRFAEERPTWPLTIHALLVANGVSAVFQGHDHVYARQTLDGIVYQTLPLPGGSPTSLENARAYEDTHVLPGCGYLRVHVSPDKATVQFVRNGEDVPVDSYDIENNTKKEMKP